MNLKELRETHKLTQSELAEIIGVKQSCIGNYENGSRHPRPIVAERISHTFGLTIEEVWNMFYKAS